MASAHLLLLLLVPAIAKTQGTYDPIEGLRHALLSSVAYCDPSAIEDWSCRPCQRLEKPSDVLVVRDHRLQVQAYAGRFGSEVVVSFRGTVPSLLRNWMVDLDALQHQLPYDADATVHSGFYEAYLSLQRPLLDFLDAHGDAETLSVTGHSLGGAMATVCASDILARRPTLYSFGSPRVGNQAFANRLDPSSSFRVVHEKDVVPQLPFAFMGFSHAGQEVWYRDSEFVVCESECPYLHRWYSLKDHLSYLGEPISNAC